MRNFLIMREYNTLYAPAQGTHNFRSSRPEVGVLQKSCSENIQQVYRRTPMPKCDFNKLLRHGGSLVNLLHIFRTTFPKNTSGGLLL